MGSSQTSGPFYQLKHGKILVIDCKHSGHTSPIRKKPTNSMARLKHVVYLCDFCALVAHSSNFRLLKTQLWTLIILTCMIYSVVISALCMDTNAPHSWISLKFRTNH